MPWIGKYIPIGPGSTAQGSVPDVGLSLVLIAYAAGAL